MDQISPLHNGLPRTALQWLFLDLNSYFASVEQQERPELRGRPVAIVPMKTDSTCAIAASYEAKAYGVKTGTKIYEAKRMCPGLVCVPARHDVYVRYHHKVIEEVIKHVPINKIWSVDELSSRLPKRLRNREAATAIAQQIKKGLLQNVGSHIKCSIGLAPNSFLAKVGTDMQKPDGLVILEADTLPGPLFDLHLTDLPGINVNMERRLLRANIRTVEEFWNLSPKHARHVWGGVTGERFWYNLHGYDVPDIKTKTRVIGHSRVLEPALRAPDKARLVTRRLTIKAASRMRRMNFYASSFYLSCRDQNGQRWTGEIRLPPAQDNFTFLGALNELWDRMMDGLNPSRLHKVSITLNQLCRGDEITPDLFDRISPVHQANNRKEEKLTGLMDNINRKYGTDAIQLGLISSARKDYIGTKIAFSRVPDMEEFGE